MSLRTEATCPPEPREQDHCVVQCHDQRGRPERRLGSARTLLLAQALFPELKRFRQEDSHLAATVSPCTLLAYDEKSIGPNGRFTP